MDIFLFENFGEFLVVLCSMKLLKVVVDKILTMFCICEFLGILIYTKSKSLNDIIQFKNTNVDVLKFHLYFS